MLVLACRWLCSFLFFLHGLNPAVGYDLTFLLHVRVPAVGYALLPAVGPLSIVESCGSFFALRLVQSSLLIKVIARYSPSIRSSHK